MSQLVDDINKDLIEAMKAKDETKVSTLRLLISSFKNKQIELGHELENNEAQETITKAAKQRRESIDAYKKGNREDLAAKEEEELKILSTYLPEQMTEEDIGKIVDQVIGETGAKGAENIGRIMGQVMALVQGRADGGVVSSIVRSKLS